MVRKKTCLHKKRSYSINRQVYDPMRYLSALVPSVIKAMLPKDNLRLDDVSNEKLLHTYKMEKDAKST